MLINKKILLSRKFLAVAFSSLIAGCLIFVTVSLQHDEAIAAKAAKAAEVQYIGMDHTQQVAAMQSEIDSLSSRVQHLSVDNKRLSSTGNRLSQQLDRSLAAIGDRLAKTKELQLELVALDQDIMRSYENLLEQQETFLELKRECKSKTDKSDKCESFAKARDGLDELLLQIKSKKGRRDVLLSQIARSDGGI